VTPEQAYAREHPPSPFELPVQPIVIQPEVPAAREEPTEGPYLAVHYSDTHFPFQDEAALSILYQLVEELRPQLIVDHGDLIDAYPISRFEHDPHHRVTLQQELRMAAEHLGTLARLAPQARRILLHGNHEDRVRRLLWDMMSDRRSMEILSLPGVAESLEMPALLGLPSSGWEYHERKYVLFDKLILKHGTVVRKWSGMSAKEEWLKYGKSGMSGHVHRRGVFEHRDWNGVHAWWELGCMCGVNPVYMEDPDWQQGLAVVTWSEDRRSFGVEEVRIHEGKAYFRGRLYQG
jgi:hypothetical protein